MEFPIDLGFSLVDRYIVTALGKIKKQFLSDWEVFKKIQFFFSLRNYPVGPSHLPGERDVFWKPAKAGIIKNYKISWHSEELEF